MSLRRVLAVALSAGLLSCATAFAAPQTAAAPVAGQATKAPPVPMLWQVTRGENRVYLLGSFHLLQEQDYPFHPDVDAAFKDAEKLVFEVHPDEMKDPAKLAAAMEQVAGYAPGQSFESVVPAPVRQKLEAMAQLAGQDTASLQASEPWLLSLGMSVGIAQALGYKGEYGMDHRLMALAGETGKQVAGLETLAAQLGALDATPYAEQVKGLDELVSDMPKAVKEMQELHATWRQGDVAKLDAGMRADMAEKSPVSYRLINIDRNRAWLPQVEARLSAPNGDDTLVVVGALHLIGLDGLVEMLRARGHDVQRICSDCAPGTPDVRN